MNYLVSFADSRMHRSIKRLFKQAKKFDFFDNYFLMNENDISLDFRNKFKDKLIFGSKGYGYWCWKPDIILNILNKINNDDCLLYLDAGCHLNINGKKRLLEYFEIIKKEKKGFIGFQANKPDFSNSSLKYDGRKLRNLKNYKWIKGDIFEFFNMKNDKYAINSQEIAGGVFLVRKCEYSINFIKTWKKIIYDNFNFVDDSPSKSNNLPGFIENRHDQAILTLLCLKNNIKTLSSYEFWYPKKNSTKIESDWYSLKEYPIHAKRDKNFGLLKFILKIIDKKKYQLKNVISKTGLIKKPNKKYLY